MPRGERGAGREEAVWRRIRRGIERKREGEGEGEGERNLSRCKERCAAHNAGCYASPRALPHPQGFLVYRLLMPVRG